MDNISRVVSTINSDGKLHIGHYHGLIKKWIDLQYEHECFFIISDINSLILDFENTKEIKNKIYEMVIDWLSCGVDPTQVYIFAQSHVPQTKELYLLLSLITPVSWLERVPSYKELIENYIHKDISTYGLLGYSLLKCTDILLYNAKFVCSGEDHLFFVELTREIARRFNHLYGREIGFEDKAVEVIKKLGKKKSQIYLNLLQNYQQDGNDDSLEKARYLLMDTLNLSIGEKSRLFAFLENKGKVIFNEVNSIIGSNCKVIGTDGNKMSTNFNNAISLKESYDNISKKIKSMETDPARIRLKDPGNPTKCPVWRLHEIYSNKEVLQWVDNGCRSAKIGCLDCKGPLIDSINKEQLKFIENSKQYSKDYNLVKNILTDGAEKAIDIAENTIQIVKKVMNINY